MKKIVILIAASLMAVATVSAGNNNLPFLKFGFKGGVTIEKQNVKFSELSMDWLENTLNDASTGYHVGITARVKIPVIPVFVQGELLYNWNNIKVEDSVSEVSTKIKTHYFSVPVLVGVGIGFGDTARIRANAGPVFNFASKVSEGDLSLDYIADAISKPAVGWTAGVGVDLFGLMIDGRYNGQFKKNSAAEGNTGKPASWSVSVGFLF